MLASYMEIETIFKINGSSKRMSMAQLEKERALGFEKMGMYTKTSVQNVFGFVRKKKLNKVLQRP
jgi:hypothetical protein